MLASYRNYFDGNIMGAIVVVKEREDDTKRHESDAIKSALEKLDIGASSQLSVFLLPKADAKATADTCLSPIANDNVKDGDCLTDGSRLTANLRQNASSRLDEGARATANLRQNASSRLTANQLLYLIESADPMLVIVLDEPSRLLINESWKAIEQQLSGSDTLQEASQSEPSVTYETPSIVPLEAWSTRSVLGRTYISLDEFGAALAMDASKDASVQQRNKAKEQKQLAWQMLKQAVAYL
jgi:hypothetical protein